MPTPPASSTSRRLPSRRPCLMRTVDMFGRASCWWPVGLRPAQPRAAGEMPRGVSNLMWRVVRGHQLRRPPGRRSVARREPATRVASLTTTVLSSSPSPSALSLGRLCVDCVPPSLLRDLHKRPYSFRLCLAVAKAASVTCRT